MIELIDDVSLRVTEQYLHATSTIRAPASALVGCLQYPFMWYTSRHRPVGCYYVTSGHL